MSPSRSDNVFVRQGHYALAPKILADYPAADIRLDSIGDLPQHNDLGAMAQAGRRFLGVTAPACRNILPLSVTQTPAKTTKHNRSLASQRGKV